MEADTTVSLKKQPRPETLVAWNGAKRWQVMKKTRQVPDPELSLTQNKAPIFKVEKQTVYVSIRYTICIDQS